MKTLRNLNVPQVGDNANFPDGQIRNQTLTQDGTPVIRELYGDVLTNIYKIVRDAGVEPNELEDSETNGYQLLEALKKFANELNDIQQIVSISGTEISVSFDFDNLPDNYVFVGKLADAISKDVTTYTFTGSGTSSYNFTPTVDIEASSLVMVSINQSGIEITKLGQKEVDEFLLLMFDGMLSYNSTNTTYYLSDGYILTNQPQSYNIQQTIRLLESDNDVIVYDAIVFDGRMIAMAKTPIETVYNFYVFELSDLTTVSVKLVYSQTAGTDFEPFIYSDGDFIYMTNNGNTSTDDNVLKQIDVDFINQIMTDVSTITLDSNFIKTTNTYFANSGFYTLIEGTLNYFRAGEPLVFVGFFNNKNGQIFVQNGQVYYATSDIGHIWNA